MFCPLFTAASIAFKGTRDEASDQCGGGECAWWDDKEGQCSWLSARFELWDLNVNLGELIEKMPREGQFRK